MRPLLVHAFALFTTTTLFAQAIVPLDVKSMLQGLQELKQKQAKSAASELSQAISDFSTACSSDDAALNFYIEGIRVTQFAGAAHEQTAFREWKKREAEKFNPPACRAVIRYTMLSLQRAAGATDRQIFSSLLAYAQDTGSMLATIWDQPIVREPVSGNLFAKWYNITEQLGAAENWEPVPGNIDGIYDKVLLPYMRKTHDPRIIDYWDKKISDETAKASNATAAFATDNFNLSRRPALLWHRAEDLVAIGRHDAGVSAMYSIVKNFPGHPDAGKWIDELQTLLTAGPTAEATGTAPASAAQ